MPDNEYLQGIYNDLKDNYNIGTIDEFSSAMQDENNLKGLYNDLKKTRNLGDYDTFKSDMGFGETQTQPTEQQQGEETVQSQPQETVQPKEQPKTQEQPKQKEKPQPKEEQPVQMSDWQQQMYLNATGMKMQSDARQAGLAMGVEATKNYQKNYNKTPIDVFTGSEKVVPYGSNYIAPGGDVYHNEENARISALDTHVRKARYDELIRQFNDEIDAFINETVGGKGAEDAERARQESFKDTDYQNALKYAGDNPGMLAAMTKKTNQQQGEFLEDYKNEKFKKIQDITGIPYEHFGLFQKVGSKDDNELSKVLNKAQWLINALKTEEGKKYVEKVKEWSKRTGIPEEAINEEMAARMYGTYESELQQALIDYYKPQDAGLVGYIIPKAFNESTLGNLLRMAMQTTDQNALQEEAYREFEEDNNIPNWKKTVVSGLSFGMDVVPLAITGSIGGGVVALSKEGMARVVGALASRGYSNTMISRILTSAANNTLGGIFLTEALPQMLQGATALSLYNGYSTFLMQSAIGQLDYGEIWNEMGKGAGLGGAFGLGGTFGNTLSRFTSRAVSGMSKGVQRAVSAGNKVVSFNIESGLFAGSDQLFKYLDNQDLDSPGAAYLNGVMTNAIFKGTSPHMFPKVLNFAKDVHTAVKERKLTSLEKYLDAPIEGVRFNKEELSELGGNANIARFFQTLTSMDASHKNVYFAKRNPDDTRYQLEHQNDEKYQKEREKLEGEYKAFMSNPNISWTTKQKVSLILGAPMDAQEPVTKSFSQDGRDVIARDENGMAITRKRYKSEEEAEKAVNDLNNELLDDDLQHSGLNNSVIWDEVHRAQRAAGISDREFNESKARLARLQRAKAEFDKAIYDKADPSEIQEKGEAYVKEKASQRENDRVAAQTYLDMTINALKQSEIKEAIEKARDSEDTKPIVATSPEEEVLKHAEEALLEYTIPEVVASMRNMDAITAMKYWSYYLDPKVQTAVKNFVNANEALRLRNAFDAGHDMNSAAEREAVRGIYANASLDIDEALDRFPKEFKESVQKDSEAALRGLREAGYGAEDYALAQRYASAMETFKGAMAKQTEDATRLIERQVQEQTYRDVSGESTGRIIPVEMKDGRQGSLVAGNIARTANGKGVDVRRTDSAVIVRYDDGTIEQVAPSDITNVFPEYSAKEEANTQLAYKTARIHQEQDAAYQTVYNEARYARLPYGEQQRSYDQVIEAIRETMRRFNNNEDDVETATQDFIKNIEKEDGLEKLRQAIESNDPKYQDYDGSILDLAEDYLKAKEELENAKKEAESPTEKEEAPEETVKQRYERLRDEISSILSELDVSLEEFEADPDKVIQGIDDLPRRLLLSSYITAKKEYEASEPQQSGETPQENENPLDKIPKDENGNPLFEQAETPELAYDAILEKGNGNTSVAESVIARLLARARKALKEAESQKAKGVEVADDADINALFDAAEKEEAEKEAIKKGVQDAKDLVKFWEDVLTTPERRVKAAEEARKKEEEEKKKKAAEEEKKKKAEQEIINGVPDIQNDTPAQYQARGIKKVNGVIIERQKPIEKIVVGKKTEVQFTKERKIDPKGNLALIEADELQPSHLQGRVNHKTFLVAQPKKNRTKGTSIAAERKYAKNINPVKVTGAENAYFGSAPTVNERGEVIQGNNRSAALKLMYDEYPESVEKYKTYLKEHAAEFGLTPEDVDKFKNPVLVNRVEVSDEEARALGACAPEDIETGGKRRIKSLETLMKMGEDNQDVFVRHLFAPIDGNPDATLAELVNQNGESVLNFLRDNGFISDDEYDSAFEEGGRLTAEAKEDIKNILVESIFEDDEWAKKYIDSSKFPVKAQRAILATAFRDLRIDDPDQKLVPEIRNAIRAFDYLMSESEDFARAKNIEAARQAIKNWLKTQDVFDNTQEKFSNFALELAAHFKGAKQGEMQDMFTRIYDLITVPQGGDQLDMFEKGGKTLDEAIKKVLGIDYERPKRSGLLGGDDAGRPKGEQESGENPPTGEPKPKGAEPTDNTGGTTRLSEQERKARTEEIDKRLEELRKSLEDKNLSEEKKAEVRDEIAKLEKEREELAKQTESSEGGEKPKGEGEGEKPQGEEEPKKPTSDKEIREKAEQEENPSERIKEIDKRKEEIEKELEKNPDALKRAELIAERNELDKERGYLDERIKREEEEANRELTHEEIDALPNNEELGIDEYTKGLAKDFLDGDTNPFAEMAYQTIKEYARDKSRNSKQDSGNADGALVGEAANGGERPTGGEQGGGEHGNVDNPPNEGTESAGVGPSGTNGEGGMATPVGEKGDNGVPEPEPKPVGEDNGGTRPSRRGGNSGKGATVGSSGGGKGAGKGVPKKNGIGRGKTESKEDYNKRLREEAERLKKEAKKGILDSLKDIAKDPLGVKESLKSDKLNASIFPLAGLGMKTAKLISNCGKYGYALVLEGYCKFDDWLRQMRNDLYKYIKDNTGISDEDVDNFLRAAWNSKMEIDGVRKTIADWAEQMNLDRLRELARMTIKEKRKLQQQAESYEVKLCDLANIEKTLPFLLPDQQKDVLRAETQFADPTHKDDAHANGKGYMFTNGTGTGKTYTGLGIVKRALKSGKEKILIVTPNQPKNVDWQNDAKNLGIDAKILENTKDRGQKGVSITTYANLFQNYEILKDVYDLIVYDECHNLQQNKNGTANARVESHYEISNRDPEQAIRRKYEPTELWRRGRELKKEEKRLSDLIAKYTSPDPDVKAGVEDEVRGMGGFDVLIGSLRRVTSERKANAEEQERIIESELANPEKVREAQKDVDKTKVVFLSATPFNTALDLDYAESYIFKYPSPELERGKRRAKFLVETFGSTYEKSSSGKISKNLSDPEQASEEEVAFSDRLQNDTQTMSGRVLDSEYDYSREFPKLDFDKAGVFNEAMEALMNGKYSALKKYFKVFSEYNPQTAFFEVIKARYVVDRIKEHIEQGRKIAVYYTRESSVFDITNPFEQGLVAVRDDDNASPMVKNLAADFAAHFSTLLEWERTLDYSYPSEQVLRSFASPEELAEYDKKMAEWYPKYLKGLVKEKSKPRIKSKSVAEYNGSVSDSERSRLLNAFNDDNSDLKVIVVQVQAGKEGISLHDTTGKMQRVLINLSLPQSPIDFIQTEGRIYRVGNKSNAIFETPLLGINREFAAFAEKINVRSQTTENLALGSQARGLRDSIARAALATRKIPVTANMGTGGKALDDMRLQSQTGYDEALENYEKWASKVKGDEKFADSDIPDPIGFKLVEWGCAEPGELVFVPDAGNGTVAKYVSKKNRMFANEANGQKFATLAMDAGFGGHAVENVPVSALENRRINGDVVIARLNQIPLAVAKVEDCGRIVALLKDSERAAAAPYFKNSWREKFKLRAIIKMPESLMQTDGQKMQVLIYDVRKGSGYDFSKELRESSPETIDLSDIALKDDFYKKLRNISIPKREIDNVARILKRVNKYKDKLSRSPYIIKSKGEENGKHVGFMPENIYAEIRKANKSRYRAIKIHKLSMWGEYYGVGEEQYFMIYPKRIEDDRSYREGLAKVWRLYNDDLEAEGDEALRKYCGYDTDFDNEKENIRDQIKIFRDLIKDAFALNELQIRNIAEGKIANAVPTGVVDLAKFRNIFDMLNANDVEQKDLADKVFTAAAKIPNMPVKIVPKIEMPEGSRNNTVGCFQRSTRDGGTGILYICDEEFNSTRLKDDFKAQTVVHELIHALTCYAIDSYKNEDDSWMPEIQRKAVKSLLDVYKKVIEDSDLRVYLRRHTDVDSNAEYGTNNESELIAELANPKLRAGLRRMKLWRETINNIEMLLGESTARELGVDTESNTGTTAYKELYDALNTLMDNFNPEQYYRNLAEAGWRDKKGNTPAIRTTPRIGDQIRAAEKQVDTNPTEAQAKAGNYKKGHVTIDGHEVSIENPKGSIRSGKDADGKTWETKMNNTYGYIKGTKGVDGDHIDVFLSDKPDEGDIYVVDQVNPKTGEFDEHKVMYGFNNEEEARSAYLANYEKGWKGLGNITKVSREEFKKWIDSSTRKTKPFADYKSVERPTTQESDVDLKRVAENKAATEGNTRRAGELVVDRLKKAGIEVSTDKEAFDKAKDGDKLTTANGKLYGFVKDGKVYLDPDVLDANTPCHEYTHLWDMALQKSDPRKWKEGKKLLKQLPLWKEVKNDPNYRDIADDEDKLASEVHSRLVGEKGKDVFEDMLDDARKTKGIFEKAEKYDVINRVRRWVNDAVKWVKDKVFGEKEMSLDDFVNAPIKDLIEGRELKVNEDKETQKRVVVNEDEDSDVVINENGDSDLIFDDDIEGEELSSSESKEKEESAWSKLMKSIQAANIHDVEARKKVVDNLAKMEDSQKKLTAILRVQRDYDRNTVANLADQATELLNDISDTATKNDIKNLISVIRNGINANAKEARFAGLRVKLREEGLDPSVKKAANQLIRIMQTNNMRRAKNLLDSILKMNGTRLDEKRVIHQKDLDVEGQNLMRFIRDGIKMDEKKLDEALNEACNDLNSDDVTVAKEAEIKVRAYDYARMYKKFIQEYTKDVQDIRDEISRAKKRKDPEDVIDALEGELRDAHEEATNKILELVGHLTDELGESAKRAKAFIAAERARVDKIHHLANSDTSSDNEGIDDEHTRENATRIQRLVNNPVYSFLTSTLPTFDQMLRMVGKKAANGEGYLWNYYMDGYIKASVGEGAGIKQAQNTLDAKAAEVFGKKGMKWDDLFSLTRQPMDISLEFKNGKEIKPHTITQGNGLYVYVVNKMNDGKVKLRKMGISEEDVERIKKELDPRLVQLADWVQSDFFKSLRNKYNAVHERLFGASMSKIENYFPLRVNSRSRIENVDIGETFTGTQQPSVVTGGIRKRTHNSYALDILNTDAMDVVLAHINEMEHWANFAEYGRDINTLLSYRRFKNRVMNMTTAYGSGERLWKNFKKVASLAGGVDYPEVEKHSVDTYVVNIAKGVTRAQIAFRVNTALKQVLSAPAFIPYTRPDEAVKAMVNQVECWNWAMENLPLFEKRWRERQMGDTRLMQTESDWNFWHKDWVEKLNKWGMAPNVAIDALTIAVGSKAVYETCLRRYLDYGYSEERAKEKALMQASVVYNESQQSSENMFVAPIQVARTVTAAMLTTFRNAPLAYGRRVYQAGYNLFQRTKKGYKVTSIEFMTKQYLRDMGYDPETATNEQWDKARYAATKDYDRQGMKDAVTLLTFSYLVPTLWNMGSHMAYYLLGDDDKKMLELFKHDATMGLWGGIEGLALGNVLSETVIGGILVGNNKPNDANYYNLPLMSSIANLGSYAQSDGWVAANTIVNLVSQAYLGVNPQVIEDTALAVYDACGQDKFTMQEFCILFARIIQAPQSMVNQLCLDELGMSAKEAQEKTPDEVASEYATRKLMRQSFLTQGFYGKNKKDDVLARYYRTAQNLVKERLGIQGDKEINNDYNNYYDTYNKINKNLQSKKTLHKSAEEIKNSKDYKIYNIVKKDVDSKNGVPAAVRKYLGAKTLDSATNAMENIIKRKKALVDRVNAVLEEGEQSNK